MQHAEGTFSIRVPTKDIPTGLRESVMNRRRFIGMSVCVTGLAGCSEPSEQSGREEDLFWSEGTPFLSIGSAHDEFSGTMRIVSDCRDDDVEIQVTDGEPDNSIPYEREELGEECSFDLYIDGIQQESISVKGTERCNIRIDADGDIEWDCAII